MFIQLFVLTIVVNYTSIMQRLQLRCYRALAVTFEVIRILSLLALILALILTIFAFFVWMTKVHIETRFYGPGAWYAWLITLGMSQGHTFMALMKTNKLPSVDYDLIAASFYTGSATIDLIAKSVTIARLGDKAGESVLLPALLCAERVVSLGTGFSLWTITIALGFGRLSGLRRVFIAIISLILALIASFFTLHAHRVISRTAPVPWCNLHTQAGILSEDEVDLNLVDFPSWVLVSFIEVYSSLELWKSWRWMAIITGVLLLVVFLYTLVVDRSLESSLQRVAAVVVCLPLGILLHPAMLEAGWLLMWVVCWWPMYFLSFFPQIGYYPPSGISVLEMDQIAALLAVAAVAAIRVLRPIFKCARSSAASSEEGAPLIPLSTCATAPGSSEQRLS
ncbi:hypothetical protein MVEN_02359900 [Mycena venus]|uniref:Uncharacterized protein n=1 Tax=Mycena venus TaxID=2733690 RepID=A0A8H6X3M9_9AGAR|nr:hypothetical protein MVEN_02359900 [Mycena venus]